MRNRIGTGSCGMRRGSSLRRHTRCGRMATDLSASDEAIGEGGLIDRRCAKTRGGVRASSCDRTRGGRHARVLRSGAGDTDSDTRCKKPRQCLDCVWVTSPTMVFFVCSPAFDGFGGWKKVKILAARGGRVCRCTSSRARLRGAFWPPPPVGSALPGV